MPQVSKESVWRGPETRALSFREIQEQEANSRLLQQELKKDNKPGLQNELNRSSEDDYLEEYFWEALSEKRNQGNEPPKTITDEKKGWTGSTANMAPSTTSSNEQQSRREPFNWNSNNSQKLSLKEIQEQEQLQRQEQQKIEMHKQEQLNKQKVKEEREKQAFIGGWSKSVSATDAREQNNINSVSLREIQEQELRQQQELKMKQDTIESSLRQQNFKVVQPRWGGAWGGNGPEKKLTLKEIQDLELKNKGSLDVNKPIIPLNWKSEQDSSANSLQERTNSRVNPETEVDPKIDSQKLKKKTPNKDSDLQTKSEKKKLNEEKKVELQQKKSSPSKNQSSSSVWNSTQSSSQSKSLRDIQEDELQSSVQAISINQSLSLSLKDNKSKEDLFWEYEEKGKSEYVTEKNEFPSLGGKKQNQTAPKPSKIENSAELLNWSKKQLKNLSKIDETSLVEHLISLDTESEAREYIKQVLGNSEFVRKFTEEFVKKMKNRVTTTFQPKTKIKANPNPVPLKEPINSPQKKKKKMQKLPAELLGFTTTLSGEIETLDD